MPDSRSATALVHDIRRIPGVEVLTPDDDAYDQARTPFYTGFQARPAVIARPVDARGVADLVRLASSSGVPLAVRGGGHSVAGHSAVQDGLLLDLRRLDSLRIDVDSRQGHAGAGLTAGEYTASAGEHGLATGFGDSPSVGVGGITLGGGVGFLHRKLGLTVDSLLEVEIVTADGEVRMVSESTEPDLFWAIRGGGGNFGVVTRFTFRLHPVDEVVGGMLVLPATARVIARFVATLVEAPDELSSMAHVMIAPPMPWFPASVHGTPIIFAHLLFAGEVEAADRTIAPLRALASAEMDSVAPMRYATIYEGEGGPPRADRAAICSSFTDAIDDAAGEAILEHLRRSTAPMSTVQLRIMGGAAARVSADATAFAHRDRPILSVPATIFSEAAQQEEQSAWTRSVANAIRRGEPATYIGFQQEDGEEAVRQAYPPATLSRLREVKRRYDPDNLFRRNLNVAPTH